MEQNNEKVSIESHGSFTLFCFLFFIGIVTLTELNCSAANVECTAVNMLMHGYGW